MSPLARRFAVTLALVVAVMVWLLARAIGGVHQQELTRHAALAEDLFDELEGELSELVAREERRTFLEYRHLYVPDGVPVQGAAGLVRSPLAELPDHPAIIGYFQLDPDGTLANPALPRDNELEVAIASGWRADAAITERQNAIRGVLGRIDGWSTADAPVAQAQQARAPKVQLKRGAIDRMSRSFQTVQTKALNVDAYNTRDDVLQNVLEANAPARDTTVRLGDVDVRVSPMEGQRVGHHLVLSREVLAEGSTYRQGLVLDLHRLREVLDDTVLEGSPLAPWVQLAWDGDPVHQTYAFTHAFAPPFQGWRVTAGVAEVPELASSEPWVLAGLFGLALAVALVGGVGAYRAVRAELELAQRRSDFAAAVSHELKTPLTTLRMYGEMLRDGVIDDPARQREYHATMVTEAERLSRLVGNVLELSRLEKGVSPAPATPIPIVDLFAQLEGLCGPAVSEAGASLHIDLEGAPLTVHAPRDGLVQALVNLVDNAVKFNRDAQDRRVHVYASAAPGAVVLGVRDHGPGVPRSQLDAIFTPFFRGERELTRRTSGTGIGLALVAGLARQLGGTASAHNHPRGGLDVRLSIPN